MLEGSEMLTMRSGAVKQGRAFGEESCHAKITQMNTALDIIQVKSEECDMDKIQAAATEK